MTIAAAYRLGYAGEVGFSPKPCNPGQDEGMVTFWATLPLVTTGASS